MMHTIQLRDAGQDEDYGAVQIGVDSHRRIMLMIRRPGESVYVEVELSRAEFAELIQRSGEIVREVLS
jgi:hypothetical protein